MISLTIPSLTQVLAYISCSCCAYYAYWQFTTGASRRRLIRDHGCKPVVKVPSWDPIFGLDILSTSIKNIKKHKALEGAQKDFARYKSNTFRVYLLRRHVFITAEPENVKTILSLNFASYSLGEGRKKAMVPFMGKGILTTDGEEWQHSRNMIRPSFTRSQISDLDMYEDHVQQLIQNIPRDGSTVDLQELFFRLTIDIATDFLFGESTNCLAQGASNIGYAEFVKAVSYCTNSLEGGGGVLSLFLPDKRFNRSCKIVHGMVPADNHGILLYCLELSMSGS